MTGIDCLLSSRYRLDRIAAEPVSIDNSPFVNQSIDTFNEGSLEVLLLKAFRKTSGMRSVIPDIKKMQYLQCV